MRPWLLLALAIPLLGGCAARSSYFLLNAERAYQAALKDQTEKYAPYEMTLAAQYLDKAREENGYSQFEQCEKLSIESQKYAEKAIEVASERKINMEGSDEIVPEERVEKPPEKKDETKIDIDVDDE